MNSYYRAFCWYPALIMSRSILAAVAATAILTFSSALLADTDGPPLFVSTQGADAGDCLDAASPCRSIDYALRRVGKNGRIVIEAGDYALETPENIFYLVSGAIDVRAEAGTTLIGVPQEFAGDLSAQGIRAIVDSKSLGRDDSQKLVDTRASLQASMAATACAGGFAEIYPCSNVDLLAHVADRMRGADGADIWGFLDLNTNREYAIMGYSTGTAVYDLSDPEDPREVGFIDGQRTTWRDIKIYQYWNAGDNRWNAYAYVTADNASDGLFIIDLTELPHRVSRVSYASDFREAHNVYITKADFATGLPLTADSPLLVIAGSNNSDGRFRTYSLDVPESPVFIAAPATPAGQAGGDRLYMHDAASMIVTDSRKDTQCANASSSSYCDVLFDFNESTVDIWDVTDPSDPVRLSHVPYSNSRYTHSGWWSEDKQYLFVQDELDERDRGLSTTLRTFSISDLRNPVLVGTWSGPTRAIDHNGFVRGNRYYMSNYARGLSILDISDPANPTAAGRFDSYPSSDTVGFPGAWGAYPFLPSGNVLISDIDSGFYIVDDNTLGAAAGSLSFVAPSFGTDETQTAALTVQRVGNAAGAIAVNWEVIAASGSLDDVEAVRGTLSWANGDAASKTIDLPISNDGTSEGIERMLVRLTAPSGGATLSSPSIASLYISDPGDAATVEFSSSRLFVPERGFGTAVAVVQRRGSASGAVSVDFAITSATASPVTDYVGPSGGTLSWADGDADPKSIEYRIIDDGTGETDEFIELTLGNAVGGSIAANAILRVDILDGSGSNAAPNAIAGPNRSVVRGGTVTLDGSNSNDPDGDTLTYGWTQTLGPAVALSNADTARASFTAPDITSDTLLAFQLAVADPGGLGDTATVAITVTTAAPPSGGGGGGGGAISLWLLVVLLLERMGFYNRLLAIRSR
jgi:choice-of-anchor B domain-containing protein